MCNIEREICCVNDALWRFFIIAIGEPLRRYVPNCCKKGNQGKLLSALFAIISSALFCPSVVYERMCKTYHRRFHHLTFEYVSIVKGVSFAVGRGCRLRRWNVGMRMQNRGRLQEHYMRKRGDAATFFATFW